MKSVSKYLSYILRHSPQSGNIVLDKEGWADIESIIKNSKKPITLAQVNDAVKNNNKKRFEIKDGRIRAVQGHSVDVDIKMEPYNPVGPLYHGTIEKNVDSILKYGLKSQKRIHVHLSKDIETATNVGKRHGEPVILIIDAVKMKADNIPLMESKNGVVLASEVPASYVKRMV